MGVKIEEEWRLRRRNSATASKSAFTFKINRKLRQARIGYGINTLYSKEVVIKITGGAFSKKGIKNAVQYMSKDGQLELVDSEGNIYSAEGIKDAINILQRNAIKADQGRELKLTHNIVFSAPRIANVNKEDALKATIKALKKKYSDNYFVAAYHDETDNPHVHVVLNINKSNGDRIDIKKKDLRELRESYGQNLIDYGYDVRATTRYDLNFQELTRENVNIYTVVNFGTESYRLDHNSRLSNYLVYRTANNKEVTIWGKELLNEIMSNNIKIGDQIRISKTGHTNVKVPVLGRDGTTIVNWKEAKRNRWSIEKAGDGTCIKQRLHPKIKLDNAEQIAKQKLRKQEFDHEKKMLLDAKYQSSFELKQKAASLAIKYPRF